MLGQQQGDDIEDLRPRGSKGEAACIGHHAAIEGDGKVLVQTVEGTHLPDDAEHDLAGAAHLGVGDGQYCRHIRIQVMVDQYPWGLCVEQGLLHLINARWGVVVETEHEVGDLQEHVALLTMLVVADDFLRVRQPQQEVGILVGHDDGYLLAQ